MRPETARHPGWRTAAARLWALSCLAAGLALLLAPAPAFASGVRVHYEDAMEDVPATEASEAEIKAAFLLRFPDFIEWRRAVGDTLRIGVAGDDELLAALLRLAESHNRSPLAARRQIAVVPVSRPAVARQVEMLVLGAGVPEESSSILRATHAAGALSVGVWNEPRGGAIIRLFREGARVRFDISRAMAEEAGLRISSKLLNLAAGTPDGGFLRDSPAPEGAVPALRPPCWGSAALLDPLGRGAGARLGVPAPGDGEGRRRAWG